MTSTTRLCRYAFSVLVVFLFLGARSHLVARGMIRNCSDVCTSDADCRLECLYDYDSEETCLDWGTCGYDYCGDGICQMHAEDPCNCSEDCTGACHPPEPCSNSACSADSDCTEYTEGACSGGCCTYGQGGIGPPPPACDKTGETCGSSVDCCSDEYCGAVDGGTLLCMLPG
jgi:hypothetical protein